MNTTSRLTLQKAIELTYNSTYQTIIFGTLKHLHQSPSQANWDDLVQEARLALAYKLVAIEDEKQTTHSYLYQCVYWRVLDLLRTYQRAQALQLAAPSDDQHPAYIDRYMEQVYERHENDQLFNQLKTVLTTQQQAYLDLLLQGYSDTEIALCWHCSRQAVHSIRQRMIKRGRQFFQPVNYRRKNNPQ
jgi:RNA polymerase sigma factor (sigma-70 family)